MAFNRVNPPEQALLPDIKERGLFNFLKELRFIVFQLWKRTGGGADYVDESRTGLYEFDDLASIVNSLLPKNPDIKVAESDYTTICDQTIICTNALTVTLNPEPKDREQVKVIISNGNVTVSGNGKEINKDTEQAVIFKNLVTTATLDIVYILETDEWFII